MSSDVLSKKSQIIFQILFCLNYMLNLYNWIQQDSKNDEKSLSKTFFMKRYKTEISRSEGEHRIVWTDFKYWLSPNTLHSRLHSEVEYI